MSMMADKFSLVNSGGKPRKTSLAPRATTNADTSSVKDQDSRSKPPAVVSPETPPLIKVMFKPSLANQFDN